MTSYTPLRFVNVRLEGAFWKERLDTVLRTTIPSQHQKLAEYGYLGSLKLPQPPPPLRFPRHPNGFSVQVFWDSDVGKWIEAASYALSHRRDAGIEAQIEAIVDDFDAAQQPDGYLNCWYLDREPDNRWTNLRDNHELYNAGHMLEGAIAYFETTGRRRWLDIMERYVALIGKTFGPGPDQKHGYCGHPEIELALMKLYRLTGERAHLDLAAYFINERGQQPHYFDIEKAERERRGLVEQRYPYASYEYSQSHRPVRTQDKVVGHAVRAMYLYTAMADLAFETGDAELKRALEVLWSDVMDTKMYVTAGLGPSAHNEGFTHDYDLPNETAYAETCASVALVFWAQRMLHLELDGKYADILEQALFNGALSGLSRDGAHYFYANPLESTGSAERWAWHTCPCCTMNVSRLVASVGGYFLSTALDGIAFHLYGGVATEVTVAGTSVAVRESSTYPWDGDIDIAVDPERPVVFDLKLRIPGWCKSWRLAVNGSPVEAEPVAGYVTIRRSWQRGDRVRLLLDMPAERLYAHPAVIADSFRVALRRGPLVYCLEEADNPGGIVQRLRIGRDAALETVPRDDLLGGIVTLSAAGTAISVDDGQSLYTTARPHEAPATLTAVPYYLWANRGRGSMLVWVPEA
ncbi:MAG: beta-L-arabinofuranosidase domain-containing protein [Devosia sp.]